ncbi:unnamed protein product [Closterium sp. Naga37s-1]|nr:unnamed protein product [Closterium sp. Naga37s-1]
MLTILRRLVVAPNGKEILKNISLGMYLGAKIGFLGANGAGKSSLMRLLAGRDVAFEGDYCAHLLTSSPPPLLPSSPPPLPSSPPPLLPLLSLLPSNSLPFRWPPTARRF